MNKENAKDCLPLISAMADGKTIQQHDGCGWLDQPNPDFNRPSLCYRIKPEPLTAWITIDKNGNFGNAYNRKLEAEFAIGPSATWRVVKFIEATT